MGSLIGSIFCLLMVILGYFCVPAKAREEFWFDIKWEFSREIVRLRVGFWLMWVGFLGLLVCLSFRC